MKIPKLIAVLLAVVGASFGTTVDAAAQFEDCHAFCMDTCGISNYFRGEVQQTWGVNAETCAIGGCRDCMAESVSGEADTHEVARRVLEASSTADLRKVSEEFGARILLHADRRLLVVLGGCEGNAPVTIVRLSGRQADRLDAIGAPALARHLSETFGP